MTETQSQIRWYQDAVIYQIHIKAFRDSNGDGMGDFRGLISKLDYLQDLGITAIWILPFYPSPLRDDGYDTADYRSVHPAYGDMRAFKAFIKEAKLRGLRVITELVLNHTSDEHAWFQRARRAPKGHPHRDFYVWSDTPDKYSDTRIIFKDFETSNWSWDELAGQYYWHRFYHHQPDLNWDNPVVVKELYSIVDYWFDLGVDGLRLDAVPYLFEREGTNCENLPETHQALKDLRAHVDANHDDKMLLAEANMWPDEVVDYLGDGDECHMAFHFPLMPRMFMATRMEDRFPIIDILQDTPEIPENAQWATFLRNHDELTLEMVTDEERDYMWRIYAEDKRARINLGIRRRLAPLLGNNRRLMELMNGLLFSLPGTPVVYYGDEIGMGDNIYLGDRDGVRTPMQWSADRNAGFSDGNPQKLYLPVVIDPEYHSSSVNVEAQWGNPESLLWWMKRLIAMRKRHSALAHGKLSWVPSENRKVLTYLRTDDDEQVLCVANLSRYPQYVELDLSQYEGYRPVAMVGQAEFPVIGELPYLLTLGPHDFFWFVLEPAPADELHDSRKAELRTLTATKSWSELLSTNRRSLEALLPTYLPERRWFRSKSHRIRSAKFRDVMPIGGTAANPMGYLTLVDVEFADIDPETYVMPLVAEEIDTRHGYTTPLSPSTIARVAVGGEEREYAIYDGLQHAGFNTALLDTLLKRRRVAGSTGSQLRGMTTPTLKRLRAAGTHEEPRPLSVEQSNSTVVFGDRFLLKVFRLLEDGVNPDVEIGRYLDEMASFPHSPGVGATLEFREADDKGDEPAQTLAILQEFIPNEGDAWAFTLDAMRRYVEDALARTEGPTLPDARLMERIHKELPDLAHETIGSYLEIARSLGERTAEMHIAMAAAPEEGDLGPEPVVPMYRRSLYQSMRASTKRAFTQLRRLQKTQPELADIVELEGRILDKFQGMLGVGLGDLRIRCHGDYHLGQVLWTGRDVRIIDFEGEPGRPIGERRIKRSALKDVAGMLRSFNYAAYTVCHESGAMLQGGQHAERVAAWVEFWYRCVSSTFLRSYLDTADGGAFLPASEDDLATMLESLLIEKAVYELSYEADNRPDWVWIPARGIQDILGD